jgi:hypothetical protein
VKGGTVRGKAGQSSWRNQVFGLDAAPSTTFRITFTVIPDTSAEAFECLDPEGCSRPQPRSVFKVLGERFERLSGPQVRMKNGTVALIASKTFRWPAGTCASEE